jgi:hypothetical protein
MLETRDLYRDYITSVEAKINTVSIKITQYHGSKTYLETQIRNSRCEFEQVGVNIDNLFKNPYIAYIKIKELVDNGQLTRVSHYVKSYVNALRYITLHELLFDRLNKCIMPYEVYLKMIGYTNSEIAKYILKGGYYRFGIAGQLYIREKARTFTFKGKPTKLPVDWGNSNKIKAKVIEEGKTPFNTANAPDGVKWHTYHNSDYAYWFWWEAGAIVNRGFFKFIPSKFVRRGHKKNIPFISEQQIYNTTEVGILNKMLELMKINPIHYLNYRRPEKIVNKEIHQIEYVNT